jgi:hypothetical protein
MRQYCPIHPISFTYIGRGIERTLRTEELSGDVEGFTSHNDDLLAFEELLSYGAGKATEQVTLAINNDLYSNNLSASIPLSKLHAVPPMTPFTALMHRDAGLPQEKTYLGFERRRHLASRRNGAGKCRKGCWFLLRMCEEVCRFGVYFSKVPCVEISQNRKGVLGC